MAGGVDVLDIGADGLTLALDYVTKTCAICAQRRKGKTYTASVIAEELLAAGIPWVVLDPTGAWWGMRSSADGESEGLPVVVLGGRHGDVPLDRSMGAIVADLVVDHPGWYVIDLSLLPNRAAEREFSAAFGERLLRRKQQPGMDFPMHLFIDEADMFVPQEREQGEQKMLGAYQAIVRRGGLAGLGSTLITQRPALVNKSVLTQLDMLILLRLVAGNDQDAIDKNYIKRASTPEQRTMLLDSLASLAVGHAWVWEPGEDIFALARIRERRTFNSSATPKVGETRVEPKQFAKVDLDAVAVAFDEAIARAAAMDPDKLNERIAELEAQLRDAQVTAPDPVAYVPDAVIGAFRELVGFVDEVTGKVGYWREGVGEQLAMLEEFDAGSGPHLLRGEPAGRRRDPVAVGAAPSDAGGSNPVATRRKRASGRTPPAAGGGSAERPDPPRRRNAGGPTTPRPPAGIPGLKAGARRIVEVLARYSPTPLNRDQVSTLAKVVKGGTLSEYVRSVIGAELAEEEGGLLYLTDEGMAYHSEVASQRYSTTYLVNLYSGDLKAGARRMLDLLVEAHPDGYSRNDLSDKAEVTKGGTLSEYVRSLIKRGLAVESGGVIRAHPTLFMGPR